MPQKVAKAKTFLLDFSLKMKDREGEVRLTHSAQRTGWVGQKKKWLKETIDNFPKIGIAAVFNEKDINELSQFLLVKTGIFAVRMIRKTNMEKAGLRYQGDGSRQCGRYFGITPGLCRFDRRGPGGQQLHCLHETEIGQRAHSRRYKTYRL